MTTLTKRATVCLEPTLHKALRLKSVETSRSLSDLLNDAIRRVFARPGLCAADATVEQVIYKAKALYPEFPGMTDLPCLAIGRNWRKAHSPKCGECYMRDLYPAATGKK